MTVNTYPDVKKVFDAALEQNGLRYRLETNAAAIHWRHRAYRYRRLLYKAAADASLVPGVIPATPYDSLVLNVPKKGQPDDNVVFITIREVTGQLETLDGKEVTLQEDEAPDEATAFRKGLTE